jgi:hypothetical protein
MKAFIKKLLPDFVLCQRRKYLLNKKKRRKNRLKHKVICYLENLSPEDMTDEKREILNYLKHHSITSVFPYDYTKKYNSDHVIVYMDKVNGMRYVLLDNKRLYFKRDWDEKQIQRYYNGLLIEQDVESPHRYETSEFYVSNGDVVVDAGVAEGNFALSVVERAKKLYLFEVDEEWIEALKKTFAPWKDKVVIVNKYVSDNNNGNCITLDQFFGQEKIDFIKADIEGAEAQLLSGAEDILERQTHVKIALCTYHRHNDAKLLNNILMKNGFHTEFSKGYMIFWYEVYDKLQPPYLRRGLIRTMNKT